MVSTLLLYVNDNEKIMYENTRADREKKRLKRIVNFFEKMTYDDYIDLH